MVQAPGKVLTLQAFLQQPETKPACEYMNGQVVQKPMPKGKHSLLQTQLSTVINTTFQPGQVAWALSELRCTFGGRSIVPDISVFTWPRIPCDQWGEIVNDFCVAPDWTIEILSPDQSQTRVIKNILHCLQHGTSLGWLTIPEEKTVFAYRPPDQVQIFDQPETILPVPSFASTLQLTVADLFSWLVLKSSGKSI